MACLLNLIECLTTTCETSSRCWVSPTTAGSLLLVSWFLRALFVPSLVITAHALFTLRCTVERLKQCLNLQPNDRYFRRQVVPVEQRTEIDITTLRVDQLKTELRSKGLSTSGRRNVLIERLRAANGGSDTLIRIL